MFSIHRLLVGTVMTGWALLPTAADATLVIDFDFAAIPAGNEVLSSENQALFNAAGDFWESAITGYVDGISRTLVIGASGFQEDPVGGLITLGSAGPTVGTTIANGGESLIIATAGIAMFNTSGIATGGTGLIDGDTIIHEIGHVLGLGTYWSGNGLYVPGSGEYTGENALAAYRNEFDPDALFVPVELDGGPGTADAHWNEGEPGDLMVLSGPNVGESLDDELLTGTLSGSVFLSDTTLGSLQDLGFTTIPFQATAVPEPSMAGLSVVIAIGSVCRWRRKRGDRPREPRRAG